MQQLNLLDALATLPPPPARDAADALRDAGWHEVRPLVWVHPDPDDPREVYEVTFEDEMDQDVAGALLDERPGLTPAQLLHALGIEVCDAEPIRHPPGRPAALGRDLRG